MGFKVSKPKYNHYRLPAQPQILKNKFIDSNEKTFEKNF